MNDDDMQYSQDGSAMRAILDLLNKQPQEEEKANYDEIFLMFIENCIYLESQAHHWHFQTNVYDAHKVLEELYQDLPEFIDSFVEGMLSSRGALPCFGKAFTFQPVLEAKTILSDFRQQCDYVHTLLDELSEDANINTLEDIMSFVDGVLYKLKVLQ